MIDIVRVGTLNNSLRKDTLGERLAHLIVFFLLLFFTDGTTGKVLFSFLCVYRDAIGRVRNTVVCRTITEV